MTALRAVKGMNDLLPAESARWQSLERAFDTAMQRAGFGEVRTPLVESTALFVRAIGEVTDVVEKEMYSFEHGRDALSLRPEGTAGVVRAYIEHKVHNTEPVTRWYYKGAMFRAERPQRGRYRQFHQLGAEVFGDPGPAVEAEVIGALMQFLVDAGVEAPRLLLNTLGSGDTRERYKQRLVAYFTPRSAELSEDSQRRLLGNPLRILDSKSPADIALCVYAPSLYEVLSPEDNEHFAGLCAGLDALGVEYTVDSKLVRGLDYYCRTLFEVKGASDKLGAGDTLAGGGRYDGLPKTFGGPDVPCFGFGVGVERLAIATEGHVSAVGAAPPLDVMCVALSPAAQGAALRAASQLRAAGFLATCEARGASLKAVLRRAETIQARYALLIGDDELAGGVAQLKNLAARSQQTISLTSLVEAIHASQGQLLP